MAAFDVTKFKMPKTIPDDVRDPASYVRGYNGANKCIKNTNEIREMLAEEARKKVRKKTK